MEKATALAKIEAAKREISAAEADLDKIFGDLRSAPRAEKTVSDDLQKAFAELRAAKARLIELEDLVARDTDD